MTWWMWITVGLVLTAIELATPGGFFVVFFGIAAFLVGALDLAGLLPQPWMQWLLFPIMAIVALRLFRNPLLQRLRLRDGRDDVDTLIGEIAIAASAILPGEHGRAELRGAMWSARNVDSIAVTAGQRCRVVAVNGLMLDLHPE